uniref:DNA polymerase epsilon catalytic subunit n=1 Tax=Aegilops tauschii subsp. strangulata TaxID=200361 RepID=A0A452ZVB9_AEGTS
MSESLVDYGEQKPCAVTRTTAKTLAEFLGVSMVKDKGMHCQYIVARESQVGCKKCQLHGNGGNRPTFLFKQLSLFRSH